MSSADPNAPRFRWNGAKSVDVIDPSNYAVRVRGDHLQPLLEPYPAQPPSAPTPSAEWTCLDNQRGLAAWLCVEPFYIEVMRHRDDQHEWSIFTGDASNRRTICVRNSTKVYESLAYAQVAAETELAKVFTAGLRTIGRGP